MKNYYKIDIDIENVNIKLIDKILGVSSNTSDFWSYELIEDENNDYIDYIEIFSNILKDKFSELEKIGICKDDITIWRLYEYEYQCNMEFSPDTFKILCDLGLTLCISCYDIGDYDIID